MAAEELIRVQDLVKNFGTVRALQGVSFAATGRAIGLLGPNGSGKSTMIKILLGLVRPSSGQASVLGLDSRRQPLRIRQLTGFMPESECMIPKMNAVTYVSFAGQLVGMSAGDALARSHDVLHALDLGEARYRDIDTYSTGMLQRVKLAQALVHHPKLLFLDEPTNGLDPAGREEMLGLIRDISQKKGINVILSSHILHDVQTVCDDLIVLHRGRLVASGPLKQIVGAAESAIDLRFRGDPKALEDALRAEGCNPRKTLEPGFFVIPTPNLTGTTPILRAARKAGAQVRHMAPAEASLEDVFAQIIEAAEK